MTGDCRVSGPVVVNAKVALGALGAILPGSAQAQNVPLWVLGAAVSPLFVLVLAGLHGLLRRRWRLALKHAALVLLWVVLFRTASYYVTSDWVIWTPLLLYTGHALMLVGLILTDCVRLWRHRAARAHFRRG